MVHLTGRGRGVPVETRQLAIAQIEFLVDEMPHLLAAATVVVSRAGMGTLTELAALGKPAVIVPMPGSHQLANASAFARLGAIDVAAQEALTPEGLVERVFHLLDDAPRRERLAHAVAASMPRDAAEGPDTHHCCSPGLYSSGVRSRLSSAAIGATRARARSSTCSPATRTW